MRYIKILLVVLLVSILVSMFVSATLNVDIKSVEVDGKNILQTGYVKGVEKDGVIDVEVEFTPGADLKDVEVEAALSGDSKKDKVSDSTEEFDVHNGTTYTKKLELKLPQRMDQYKSYQLRVTISNKDDYKTVTGTLDVSSAVHALQIKDIVLSPENEVKAGRALLVTARVKNRGTQTEEDIKVKASVPSLGISASDYIDELDAEGGDDDSTTSEELYMRVPDCAEPGQYTVQVCAEFNDGDDETCETTKINLVESDICAIPSKEAITTGKTIITIGPETQNIARGGSAMYPVTIANEGLESKVYSIVVDAADWAEFSVTPSNTLVVGAGESKAAYISVKPKSSASGLQVFSATIKSGENVLKQVPLRASITGGAVAITNLAKIKKVIQIGAVLLVVLLVIVGLIIGFYKLKGSEEEEEKEEKTYY